MQRKRAQWKDTMSQLPSDRILFLDESGVNTNLTRKYGRSVGKTRVVGSVPLNTPKTTTVVSSIRLNGQLAYTEYEGGTTKLRFLDYIKTVLVPTLHPGDYVVMDNLSAHHSSEVEDTIKAAGATPLYLPPYSPDMNPIEKMWSKMKAILRAKKVRVSGQLRQAIADALSRVSAADCSGWFCAAGYYC